MIGCDVSKEKLDIAILDENQRALCTFRVPNAEVGLNDLIHDLNSWNGATVIMEATSHYHYLSAFMLREAGFDVRVINPYLMKQFMNLGLRKTKTDKMDAKRLAAIGWSDISLPPFTETTENIEQKQRVRAATQLSSALRIITQQIRQIEETLCVIGGGADILQGLEQAQTTMKQELARMQRSITRRAGAEAKLIATIDGISEITAAEIKTVIGDVARFKSRDAIAAFAGVDPSVKESGSSVHGKSHISKRGSDLLRRSLGHAAWGAMMHNDRFKEYAKRKKEEGFHYFEIIVAIERKLIHLIYSMLRTGQPYDPLRYQQR